MRQQVHELKITHKDISDIFNSLLKIPRTRRTLHPCQQRSKYSDIIDWLAKAASQLIKMKDLSARQLCERQQQIIVSCLQELIELTKKECAEKSLLLEMVLEYLVGTLNTYWRALENANREVWYQFENNSVRVERDYINELKRVQGQNQQLKKDKQHRWRNMFMLIKDNRIHRRQNKKLQLSINYEMEKNVTLAEQMIQLRDQNQKLKLKLACFQNDPIRIQAYVETHLKLLDLDRTIRNYPKRSKKILKNELLKIEIQQINNLNDRIKFIIKAIEETGEIIDEFYDEQPIWSNFQYNISTQTEIFMDDKATNTPSVRTINTQTVLFAPQLAKLQSQEVYNIIIRGVKKIRKQTKQKQIKNVMFMSATSGFGHRIGIRRQEDRKEVSYKKVLDCPFSICESVKMTIYNGRISYISTYNTEIFNGIEIIKKIQDEIQKKDLAIPSKKAPQTRQIQSQTEPQQESPKIGRSPIKISTKFTSSILPQFSGVNTHETCQSKRKKTYFKQIKFSISEQVNFQFNPLKNRSQHHKFKIQQSLEKEQVPIIKNNYSQKGFQSIRNLKASKRLNSVQKFYPSLQDSLVSVKKIESQKKAIILVESSAQTDNKICSQIRKSDSIVSLANIQQKQERQSLTKATHNSGNSSFIGSVDLQKLRNEVIKKPFNQSADNFMLTKVKQKIQRKSQMSPLQSVQPKKMVKVSKNDFLKHKRTATQSFQNQQRSQSSFKPANKFKVKQLHRISEVLTETDNLKEQNRSLSKDKNSLPMQITRQGQIRSIDFAKSLQKILKNMDVRRNQIISNNYTLKMYLSSYFKCLYGRQIYNNFIVFLSKAEPQQGVICFSRLSNSKMPQPYLIDIFKAFVKSVAKCYLFGQSPCATKLRQQVLKFLLEIFLQESEIDDFTLRMRSRGCFSLMGWFNALELELRANAIQSQLYNMLSSWLGDVTTTISYSFIEQLAYFMNTDQDNYKYLIKCKFFFNQNSPMHRLCLFSYRFQWVRMLNLQSSIHIEYNKKLGSFNINNSIKIIEKNKAILNEFPTLNKSYKYWTFLNEKYETPINQQLVMLIELNILQFRLKIQSPLSKELKYLSLSFEGLRKKKQFEKIKNQLDSQVGEYI